RARRRPAATPPPVATAGRRRTPDQERRYGRRAPARALRGTTALPVRKATGPWPGPRISSKRYQVIQELAEMRRRLSGPCLPGVELPVDLRGGHLPLAFNGGRRDAEEFCDFLDRKS